MTERQAFLDAIKADPRDEATRKVFADYLDEHDEPELADWHRSFTAAAYDEAKAWLTDFAARCGPTCTNYAQCDEHGEYLPEEYEDITYDTVVQAGHDLIEHGDAFVQRGSETARNLMWEGDNRAQFWRCWGIVTDTIVSEEHRSDTPFSCSC